MNPARREFIRKNLLAAGGLLYGPSLLYADVQSDLKITKIKHYQDPDYNKPTFAQMRDIVVVETSDGTIGIGEGGSKEMIPMVSIMVDNDVLKICTQ